MKKKRGIGFSILVTMIPIMLLMTGILTGYSYVGSKTEVKKVAQNLLMQIAKDTAEILQTEFKGNAQLSENIATYVGERGLTEPQDIIPVIKEKYEKLGFKTLAFADKNGNFVDLGGNTTNIADTEHFKMAIEGTRAASELYRSDIDGSVEVAYCAPIYVDNEIIGIIAAINDGMDHSNLANSIDVGNGGYAFVIDKATKQILAYPDKELVTNMTYVDELVAKDSSYISFGKAVDEMVTNIQGNTEFTLHGKTMLLVHTGILSDYWIMGVAISEDEIFANTNRMGIILVVISLLLTIVASIMVILLAKHISKDTKILNLSINEIANGNFSNEIDSKLKKRKNEFGDIARNLQTINTNISGMVNRLKSIASEVTCSTNTVNEMFETVNANNVNISTTIEEVAEGNSMQTENLSNITMRIDSFSNLFNDMKDCLLEIENVSKEIDTNATSSNTDMTAVVTAMNEMNEKFQMFTNIIMNMEQKFDGIMNITKLIQEISKKTNLLSLNAAIESARAGEAGRGFSVVAEEIGKLANESSTSIIEINTAIEGIATELDSLVRETTLMNESIHIQNESIANAMYSFKNISDSVARVTPMIEEVTTKSEIVDREKTVILDSVENLLALSEEVTASAEGISSYTKQITALSDETKESSEKLVELTDTMEKDLNYFKTNQ